MSNTVTLKNKELTVEISTLGAELRSVRDARGCEYIWEGDPNVWAGRAPLVFPICGGLKDDRFTLDGQSYTLQKHGFARFEEFTLLRSSATEAVFSLHENEGTLAAYPFRFVLMVAYVLDGRSVRVTYTVHNMSHDPMYFSIGGHEGFATPEGIENYDLYFDRRETLSALELHGNLLSRTEVPVLDGRVLPLKEDYFKVDALVFAELNSRAVTLSNRAGGRCVRVTFEGFDHLLLWQKPGARYLCIEPWTGLPDFEDTDGDITQKDSITALAGGESFSRTHTLAFGDR